MIAIDAPVMSSAQPGGYRTYATSLIGALAEVDRESRYLLLVDRAIPWQSRPNWTVELLKRRTSIGFIWREQIAAPRLARERRADVYHALGATGPIGPSMPLVLTLHDAIGFTDPLPSVTDLKRWAIRLYSRAIQRQLVQRARAIITISDYSKRQISRCLNVPADKIVTIYGAPSALFYRVDKGLAETAIAEKYGLRRYVFALASAEPRKNIRRLLTAYAGLPSPVRSRHPLVLVCTHEAARRRFSAVLSGLGLASEVHLLSQVSDQELAFLYGAASLFVYPSLEEGFGLPPLEAMACGTAVIASSASSIPEVLGEAALLVSPHHVEALTAATAQVLDSPGLREELQTRGQERTRQFSWQRAAIETVAVYRAVDSRVRLL